MQNNTTNTGNTQTTVAATATLAKPRFTNRIGGTTYRVRVHFSDTSRETMNDKLYGLFRTTPQAKKQNNFQRKKKSIDKTIRLHYNEFTLNEQEVII